MTLDEFNVFLLDHYGRSNDFPRFRIVFSDTQLEKRIFYDDAYLYGIYLGTTNKRIEEVRKYPFIRSRYVFEKHYPTDAEELVDKEGNYEPIYVFEDDQGNPLPLDLDIIQFIAKALLERVEKKTPGQLEEEKKKEMDRQVALEYEMLDNKSPYIATMINNGEAVFIDSKKRFE